MMRSQRREVCGGGDEDKDFDDERNKNFCVWQAESSGVPHHKYKYKYNDEDKDSDDERNKNFCVWGAESGGVPHHIH